MMKCRERWVIGDLAFKGWSKPHIFLQRGWRWKVPYHVHQMNEYCQATGGSNCVDSKSDTYRGGKV
jgi:hypothetical protein